VIEMMADGDSQDDEDREDYPPSRAAELYRLAVSAPAMGLAALGAALASLTIVVAAQEIGEAVLFGSHKNPSNLTALRVSAAVRLGIGLVAFGLAFASGVRVRMTGADDESTDPLWVRAVIGAALILALLSIVLSGVELIYTLSIHSDLS
jgi:hypothetical protein